MPELKRVLVTGGAGYVGAVLVPELLRRGYAVRVLDLYLFGDDVLQSVKGHPGLQEMPGDLRDPKILKESLRDCDAVIHLACISNDPSFELNPNLSRSINYEAFGPLMALSKSGGIRRFIYASTSSVYGVSSAKEVTEEHPLVPLTDYNKYKGLCEPILLKEQSPNFTTVVVRPATVCGYSPRLRLDLTVNLLTAHAVHRGKITVFGGAQMRPNIHIQDMVDVYPLLLEAPREKIAGQVFNAGYQNQTVAALAQRVKAVVEEEMPEKAPIQIETVPSNDPRSYHISSEKIRRVLGFKPKRTIEDAVRDLVAAFRMGRVPGDMTDTRYINVKAVQAAGLR